MYLSHLILNPRHPHAARDIRYRYELHRTLMTQAFLNTPKELERVLWRLDANPRSGKATVWMQSQTAPDWSFLQTAEWRGYLAPEDFDSANPDTRIFEPKLERGLHARFRLLANPTVKRKNKKGGPARHRIFLPAQQQEWLRAKLEQGGAVLSKVQINTQGDSFSLKKETGKLMHYGVLFEGELQIHAPDEFARLLAQGIGSGKAFGFGLLSLARA